MADRPGSTIMKEIVAAGSAAAREKIVLDAIDDGEVPSWMWSWRPVRVSATVDGKPYVLEYRVTPDYVSLGDDEDYFRAPMLPATAQKIADDHDAILPSTRMVNEIYANASARLQPQSIYPNTGSVSEYSKHEIAVQRQMATLGVKGGTFLAGHKKDIVIGPSLNGSKVAIYGWHDESGQLTGGKANAPIQPYSTIHDSQYTDYAHGVRLVKKKATLNGSPVDLSEIFNDPKLSILVSTQGPFDPKFPNVGGAAPAGPRSSVFTPIAASISSAVKKDIGVTEAQTILTALGYQPGPIDGLMGQKTKAALVAFQKAEGLPQSGAIDQKTKERLAAKDPAASTRGLLVKAGMVAAGVLGAVVTWSAVKHFSSSRAECARCGETDCGC